MSERKRLHPITAISNFLNHLKSMIIPIVALLAIGHGKGKESFWNFMPLITMGFVVIIVLFSGIVKWLRFTYRLEDGELRIEYGLLVKKKRYIPFERIQSLNFSEGILQRPFGLVKVIIETAGSNLHEAEAELTAIKKSEAVLLQRTIAEAKNFEKKQIYEVQNGVKEIRHYKISTRELLIISASSGGIGVIFSAVLAFLSQLDNFIPYKKIFNEVGTFIHGGVFIISTLIILGLLIAWLVSIFATFLKYSGFTISEEDNDLIITRGLLERRKITIPLNRIQAIRVSEHPLQQLFGYVSVFIESAGGNLEDKESRNIVLLPMVKRKDFPTIVTPFLKDYHFQVELLKAPLNSRINYVFREILKVIPLIIILIIIFKTYGLFSLCLLLYPLVISHFRYHAAGWNIHQQQLTLRYRSFLKHTVYMKKNRIQSIEKSTTWFQRRKQLASIHSTVKSTGVGRTAVVRHLKDSDINAIYHWYSPDTKEIKS
jgi:putative membrane protein